MSVHIWEGEEMSSRTTLKSLSVVILLLSLISPRGAEAQSIDTCGGLLYLGTNGPEICVSITETNPAGAPLGAPVNFRAPAGPGAPPLPIPPGIVVGEYTVVVMGVAYVSVPAGMSIEMDGMVTRTSPGNHGLSIIAAAGWGMPLLSDPSSGQHLEGTLNLDGDSTGTSRTEVGGAAGFPAVTTPAQDVQFVGFPQTIVETTFGAGPIAAANLGQPVNRAGAVAVRMHTNFHLNNVGDFTAIPSGVGLAPVGGTPPTPDTAAAGGQPHFECYSVKEHDPQKKYRDVKLADQFAKVKKKIGKITRICTPVDKNEEGIPDPKLHLVCYEILKGHDPNRLVQTSNQFGKTTMNVRKAQELCVPSTKKPIYKEQRQKQEPRKQKVK